ncbi:MAG TPA: biliverdin-producing heme oxygenase [Kofleriaceae bacterium]
MLNRLDMETREQHAEVDGYWLDLMASGVTREQYKGLLVRIYGFEAPVESALVYTPNLVIADRRERMRSGLIAQDLLALGISPGKIAALPQCCGIEPFADPAEALGWKYVIERPTQLHSAIKRNILTRLDDIANACSYLSACDGIAAGRWQQFGLLLDDLARRPHAADRVVGAAKAAFTAMSDWFKCEPSEQVVHA